MEWHYNEETGIHYAGPGYATHIAYFSAETKRYTLRHRSAEDRPWVTVGEFSDWGALAAYAEDML